jgi:predicted MFS family arabinose efflux permease
MTLTMAPPERPAALRPFVAAMVIDALGSGFYLPFAVLYFVVGRSLPIGVVASSFALANALVIPLSMVAGVLVDRWRPLRVLAWGNALRCAVFVGYLFADDAVRAALVIGAAAVLDKFCWVAQASLIGALASGAQSRGLFGTIGWARNLGIGVGSAAGGVGASLWGTAGMEALVLANAASYAAVAVILLRRVTPPVAPARGADDPTGRYRDVLRDGPFLVLVVAKFCFVLCAIAVADFLPYYLRAGVGLPTWMSGLVLTVNCGLIVLAQLAVTRRLSAVRPTLLLAAGGATYVAGGLLFLLAGRLTVAGAVGCVLVGIVVYTVGEIVIAPSSDSLATDLAPAAGMGRYQSVYQLGWSVGSVVVPAAGAVLLGSAPGWFWGAFAVVAAAGAALCLLAVDRVTPPALSRRRRPASPRAARRGR